MTSTEPAPARTDSGPPDGPRNKRGLLRRCYDWVTGSPRRLYDWVLHWADTKHATPALFTLSLAESSFFPIPPDVLLGPLCLGNRSRAFRFAFWCSIASVIGGVIGYGIGVFLWEDAGVSQLFYDYVPGFTHETFLRVQEKYDYWNFWIVFAAGFTPLPFKVITITAGVFGINFWMFLLASVVGRSSRFYLVAFLLNRYGAGMQKFIDRHFGWITLAFCALGIGGFLALEYLL